jgi:hypothetical protein
MKTHFKRTVFFSFCLTAFLFALSATPKSYAATLTSNNALSGSPCPASIAQNTGVSYDANTYTTTQTDNPVTPQPMGMFSLKGSNAPAIGAWNCSGGGVALSVGNVGASWYNVQATTNGVTTTPSTNAFNFSDHMQIDFSVQADQQYTFRVQSCSRAFWWIFCSAWSPTLHFTTAANSYCLNGYVWREATPFDHVCVTPAQRSQAAYDNSQAASRIDPSGAYGPQSCVYGYVWREAFGGDYVCVTPGERSLVAYDNSQAVARIVAL